MAKPVITEMERGYIINGLILLKQSKQRAAAKEVVGSQIRTYHEKDVVEIDSLTNRIRTDNIDLQ